jgi:hypothetical protein
MDSFVVSAFVLVRFMVTYVEVFFLATLSQILVSPHVLYCNPNVRNLVLLLHHAFDNL